MTLVQDTYIAKGQTSAKSPQKGRFLTGSHDLFSFLKKDVSPTAQANDLLKTAYKMLEQAERDLTTKNKRIKDLENALTNDELTGLANRRGFYSAFTSELDRTNRGNNSGGLLIMIDLDYFKTINDTFGHQAGDEALKIVGTFLQSTIRNMDVAARLGGDEFIVLMPNTSIAKAMQRAQKLGKDLNNLSFKWDDSKINISGSLGLTEYKQGDTLESIIDAADKGMYQNKESKKQTRH